MSLEPVMEEPDGGAQRIDKWLWHARFARTRGAAQRLALSGHVRVNRERVAAASRLVRPGDVLTIALGRGVRVVVVRAIGARRGSAEEAQRLYEEVTGGSRSAPHGDHPPHRLRE
ncbi:MAG TPA: RNA-binding S4 domain-containing protein [Afifellaceae bacterium]|nr:RNA-binding S4 domain-containing protein [Afifellaceae bacterium]